MILKSITSFRSGAEEPDTTTLKVHRPEPETIAEIEPDVVCDMPEFTEELLLKMLANLNANGMTLCDLAG